MNLFNKPEISKTVKFPGRRFALDGHGVAYTVATMASDAVLIQSSSDLAEITGPLRNLVPTTQYGDAGRHNAVVCHVDDLRALTAKTSGFAATGLRSSAIVTGLGGIRDALYATVGKRLACIFNMTCRAIHRQASSLHGGHDDYYSAAGSGAFLMFAKNCQEVSDFSLIAHRVAELSLTPGICAQDFYQTSQSIQNVCLPEVELVQAFLGRSEDMIDSPTPAQSVLFGKQRRRVPAFIDRDHPVGIGGTQDDKAYFKAFAAQMPFFTAHIDAFMDQAFREFGELTGRTHSPLSGYRIEDADYVVLGQGAVVEALEAVVDHLRHAGIKAGAIGLSVFRPFPGASLSHILKGKAAVTVLERTDQPLAEDLPLTVAVRAVIAKATENSSAAEPVHPGYAAYRHASDRCRVFTGIYGIGTSLPSFADLAAGYENMITGGRAENRFYIGSGFSNSSQTMRRFPHLQTLQQRLNHMYPGLEELTISGSDELKAPEPEGLHTIQLYSLALQGGIFAGNLFAQAMADALEQRVRTFPVGGLEPGLQSVCHTIAFTSGGKALRVQPESVDILLATSESLLEKVSARANVKPGGLVVVGSSRDPESLWSSLSRSTRKWVRDTQVRLYLVDTNSIASETASKPSFVDQLEIWALLGTGINLTAPLESKTIRAFAETLSLRLEQVFGENHYLVKDINAVVSRGGVESVELDWKTVQENPSEGLMETPAPWTVRQSDSVDGTVFDPKRFWHSVGYLYDCGKNDEILTDPYVATGIIPAGSSAFRDMTPYRMGVPNWLPENCGGCGQCWTHCPDSSLPPTIQTVSAIIENAVSQCEAQGHALVQFQRVGQHLSKQAYRVIAKDDLCQFRTMGSLLRESFSQLAEKLNLDEEQLDGLKQEFEQVCSQVQHYPVARTKFFFDDPHRKDKGSGHLLSITLNPMSCKGCGLCVSVCPEQAFGWTRQTSDFLDKARANWQVQMQLPVVPKEKIDDCIDASDPGTQIFRLLDRHNYHSMVGGDGAFPGNSTKTALHLVTAAIESVMRPRFEAHIQRLSKLIQDLEHKIQGKIDRTVEINDFESFGHRLDQLGTMDLASESLARLAGHEGIERTIDPEQLKQLTELLRRLKQQRRCYVEGAGGGGRARMVLTIDPSDATTFWNGTYPDNPHPQPWMTHLPGDAPALAEGLFEGVARTVADELKWCHLADLALEDNYDPKEQQRCPNWREFTDEQRDLLPPVLVIAHAGVTDWDEIARLLFSDYPIKIAMINTEAVSIPGSAAGWDAPQEENDPGLLGMARRGAFVLQSSIGHPGHLIRGVVDGLSRPYPAVFHIHAPDALAHGIAPEKTARQAKLAYLSRAFPLFEADPTATASGLRAALSLENNPDPAGDWTQQELTFVGAAGAVEKLTTTLTVADWAIGETRFQEHFRLHSKGHLNNRMKLLPDYLALDADQRPSFEPFIHLKDDNDHHLIAMVSLDMVRAVEQRLRFWTRLRELSALGPVPIVNKIAEPQPDNVDQVPTVIPPSRQSDQALHEQLTERLLWLCGYSQDPDFFKQSLSDFITHKRASETGETQPENSQTVESQQ